MYFEIELEGGQHFKYLFMELGSCIRGFRNIRLVIIVDSAYLKGKYQDTMLVAVAMDDNN